MVRLRSWQKEATAKALIWFASKNKNSRYFILNVAPGAGKTICAAHIADRLINEFNEIDRVIIIAPRSEVVNQWGQEYKNVTGRNTTKVTGADINVADYGMDLCATWAAISKLQGGFQEVCDKHKTLVICDEHHHAAVKAVWGQGANDAFAKAKYILLLTGTPIRGDGEDAVWLAYDSKGEIEHPEQGTYTLTYGQAVDLEYCRPITFHRHIGKFSVDLSDGEQIKVSNTETSDNEVLNKVPALQRALEFYRLACIPTYEKNGTTPKTDSFQATMLQWGIEKLKDAKREAPTASGLVIAPSIKIAEYMAELLEMLDGQKPIIVHSDEANAQNKIKAFKNNNNKRWLVSVAMISEGVDIPRLRVLVYLPYARTELAFRQAMGRVVRSLGPTDNSRAYVVMPTNEIFDSFARRVENEMSPGKRKEDKIRTKKCPKCEKECALSATKCDECGYEFPPETASQKACDECGHLNPMKAESCEKCGASLQDEYEFILTLEDALREGVIARGMDITEEDTQWGEVNAAAIRSEILRSGDAKLIKIIKDFPPESLKRVADILKKYS